jgi:biotin carboxylase
MISIAYVAPFFMTATVRFLSAVAEQPGVRIGLISSDPVERLPAELRQRLVAHQQVRDALNPASIAEAVRAMAPRIGHPDLLLGTLEQLQVPLAQVRGALNIPGLREQAAKNFRDKSQMKDVLRAAGLPVARHRLVESIEAGVKFAREVGGRLVIKPPDGAGAKATFQARNESEVEPILRRLSPRPGHPVLCEEFVQGSERTLEVASLHGKPVWWSSCRYDPTPLHVLENPWIQWTITLPREQDDPATPEVRKLGFAALRALGMETGLSHMEWFRRADGSVAISEIGARPPGAQIVSLMSFAHDLDLFRAWGRMVVHGEFDPPARQYAAGAAFLRGQGGGDRVTGIRGLDAAQRALGHLVVETKLPRVGQAMSSSYEGEGYVIVRHPQTEVVEKALATLITTVQVTTR